MNFFCLLWAPLFYLFWISLGPLNAVNSGGLAALFFGCVWAVVRYTTGPWIFPGEFGFSRWLSALVDTVGLPALAPFLFFVLFAALKITPSPGNPSGFALLWLIPEGILRSISRAGRHDPVFLALVPVLWTSLALGIPFFVRILLGTRVFQKAFGLFGIAALPAMAVTCYWAFFGRYFPLGWVLFAVTLMPPFFSIIVSLCRPISLPPPDPSHETAGELKDTGIY
jgi:hypothetical protein